MDNFFLRSSCRYSRVHQLRWHFLPNILGCSLLASDEVQWKLKEPLEPFLSSRARRGNVNEGAWTAPQNFGGWIITPIWSWCVIFAAPLCLRTKICSVQSQKPDSQHWSMMQLRSALSQRHHDCVSYLWITYDLTWKINWNYIFIQHFCLSVFIELQVVLFC